METQVEISIADGKITVAGPFSGTNNEIYRKIGGKFTDGAWEVPDSQPAREKIAELFGAKSDIVTIAVPADSITENKHHGGRIQVGGYVIASRRHTKSDVTLPRGVIVAVGSLSHRGGSYNYPEVNASADVVFHVNVRRAFAEKSGYEIVGNTPPALEI